MYFVCWVVVILERGIWWSVVGGLYRGIWCWVMGDGDLYRGIWCYVVGVGGWVFTEVYGVMWWEFGLNLIDEFDR